MRTKLTEATRTWLARDLGMRVLGVAYSDDSVSPRSVYMDLYLTFRDLDLSTRLAALS